MTNHFPPSSTAGWAAPSGATAVPRRPINTLLIANRGEIAVRIARTARRLGIRTVGVYSEPDANALHLDTVDIAVALGGATAAESYLRGDAIIAAAQRTDADAIHPGYGFLAENAKFAEAVGAAGLVWVGPTPEQITLLGDKVAAKRAAVDAGVPTTPIWEVSNDEINSGDLGNLVDDIAMPALVKAAAGGGGRGMRVVREAAELSEALVSASREALAAFGDGTVFIEPYIERGRHIEVQIMGDCHGNVVHLGERECSIQRRNQKVVEEAPSAGISPATRNAVCEGALALARSVGYLGAGTVEFLVAESDDPSHADAATINFLEVNTRLQVEHPVTEAVTGLDLVEMQLRVAAGEPLAVAQSDVSVTGHAIEVRVVAEDPSAGWMPSTGTVRQFDLPGTVRVDTGIRPGTVVSPNYDSLLAKVISSSPTRHGAAAILARALREARVVGVDTNIDMAIATLGEPDFLAARTPTSYLDEHPDVAAAPGPTGNDFDALLIAAVFAAERQRRMAAVHQRFAPSGFRNLRTQGQRAIWRSRADEHHVEHVVSSAQRAEVLLGAWPTAGDDGVLPADERKRISVWLLERSNDVEVLEVDGLRTRVEVSVEAGDEPDTYHVVASSAAGTIEFEQCPRFVAHQQGGGGSGPICPLPGTVISVHVQEGDVVASGDVLMVVEAMKMEHKITAAEPATVAEVRFVEGDRVDQGDLLVALASPDDAPRQ